MRECIRVMTIKHARERELCILQSYSYNHLLSLTIILQFTMRKLKLNETCMFGCVCVCEYNSCYSYFDFGVKSSPSLTLWIDPMRTCVFYDFFVVVVNRSIVRSRQEFSAKQCNLFLRLHTFFLLSSIRGDRNELTNQRKNELLRSICSSL